MHYFKDRQQAGELLVEKIKRQKKTYSNPAIIALDEGGVLVATEISKKLHAPMYMLTTEDVELPGENSTIGMASSQGNFIYNNVYSSGQLDEIKGDYRQIIDQEQYKAFQKLNRIVGKDGLIKKDLLKKHEIILVTDGLRDPMKLEVAADFLKPIDAKKIVIAVPIATVDVVDRMHLLADEVYCLGVIESYFLVDHYYQSNNIPDRKTAVKMIKNIVFNW